MALSVCFAQLTERATPGVFQTNIVFANSTFYIKISFFKLVGNPKFLNTQKDT